MALLTGTLYTKKTYGKTIFGDLVQAAGGSVDDKADATVKKTASGEVEQAASRDLQEQASNQASKEMLSARDPSAAGETKSSWRSAGGKSKRPSKDFFTPKDESGEPDVETEKESSAAESADKRTKRKPPPQPHRARISYPVKNQSVRTGTKGPVKTTAKDTKDEVAKKVDEYHTERKHNEELSGDKSGDESDAEDTSLDVTDSEEPSRKLLETVVEEADEDMSESESEDAKKKVTNVKKPVIIKTIKSTKSAEQNMGTPVEEGPDVLHPDAIVNLRRELARKGIIRNYEDVDISDPQNADAADVSKPDLDVAEPVTKDTPTEQQTEKNGSDEIQDEDKTKEDVRDGFKTNKSFEIRRLQAKAEREREDKGSIFSKPKFLRGIKAAAGVVKNEETDTRYDEHRKNWIRKKPKSILKPRTSEGSREWKKKQNEKRKSATVRIREPGYGDYNVYSAADSEESTDSIISQSSSVFGYRPNSETSLSSESSISFADDGSLDSEAMQDLDDEDAFYRSSVQGRTVHDIYDDIDRLNPSRLTNVRFSSTDVYENRRVASADNSYVDRSSLHILRGTSRQSQRPSRRNSAVRAYEDKPLQLFDAMRYANETAKPRGASRDSARKLKRQTSSREKRLPSRESRRSNNDSRQSQRNPFPNGAVAFGPNLVPLPHDDDVAGRISEKEWVDRAQKFFATANAGRRKQVEQRKRFRKPGILKRFGRKFKRKKRPRMKMKKTKTKSQLRHEVTTGHHILPPLCYCDCCPKCCSIFFCETKSLWSSVVLTFVPTAVISTLVVLALFWGLGIFSIM